MPEIFAVVIENTHVHVFFCNCRMNLNLTTPPPGFLISADHYFLSYCYLDSFSHSIGHFYFSCLLFPFTHLPASCNSKPWVSLFVPVTVCMMFVVIVASTVDFYSHTDHYLIYTPFHTPDADVGTQTWQTIANTLIFMSFIVVMTFVLVLLFKYSCYKVGCIECSVILQTYPLLNILL